MNAKTEYEIATFAAGCFWGVQQAFDQISGVIKTTVGYTGGHTVNPTYEDVCTDETGHAESVEVQFDPKKVTFEKLLEAFWMLHDPTTVDRQGPDVGSQYRSAIFYHSEDQRVIAEKSKQEQQKNTKRKIVTEITKATEFYSAEDYHQKYYKKHNVSCHVTLPKSITGS